MSELECGYKRSDILEVRGVYAIINKTNLKIYVGSTKNFYGRFYVHRRKLRSGVHSSAHLQHSWNTGKYEFEFKILERVDDLKMLFLREQYYMDLYKSCGPELGYNTVTVAGYYAGGRGLARDKKMSKETRIKMSKALTDNWAKMSEEGKNLVSLRFKGRVRSSEERDSISRGHKLRHLKLVEAGVSRKLSPEVCKQRSETAKLVWARKRELNGGYYTKEADARRAVRIKEGKARNRMLDTLASMWT